MVNPCDAQRRKSLIDGWKKVAKFVCYFFRKINRKIDTIVDDFFANEPHCTRHFKIPYRYFKMFHIFSFNIWETGSDELINLFIIIIIQLR